MIVLYYLSATLVFLIGLMFTYMAINKRDEAQGWIFLVCSASCIFTALRSLLSGP